ncbi:MAG: DUF948 domain-containing protein [Bacteroidia bacterium]
MPTTPQQTNQQPDIVIPNTGASNIQFVSNKDFDEHKKDFDFQKSILNWTFGFVVAVLLVCFISFITFIIDAWKFHGDTTKEFNITVQELKKDNSTLKLENINEKLQSLEKKLEELKPPSKSENGTPSKTP